MAELASPMKVSQPLRVTRSDEGQQSNSNALLAASPDHHDDPVSPPSASHHIHEPPGSPTVLVSPSYANRSNSTRRDRRLSRNSRPPQQFEGPFRGAHMRGVQEEEGHGENIHTRYNEDVAAAAGPSQPRNVPGSPTAASRHALAYDRMSRSPGAHTILMSDPDSTDARYHGSPRQMLEALDDFDEDQLPHMPGSPSSYRPTALFSLPLFAEAERTRVTSSPLRKASNPWHISANETTAEKQGLSRAQSMRESGTSAAAEPTWHLPSHNRTLFAAERNLKRVSPSASMSALFVDETGRPLVPTADDEGLENDVHGQGSWARTARRWSSSIPRGRHSTAFALRLAEGASPFLRAGLEELRNIFDVDSNPIPPSPFPEDDDDPMHLDGFRQGSIDGGSQAMDNSRGSMQSFETNLLSIDGSRHLTASPAALSSRDLSPSRSSIHMGRTPSDESGSHRHGSGGTPDEKRNSNNNNNKDEQATRASRLPFRPLGLSFRSESSFGFDLRSLAFADQFHATSPVNKTLLAWCLSAIATGLIALCAWGYAMQSDTFSVTLIVFFLTQPAFAIVALTALILRKRAWMDLFSRAMRAHVLAQTLIVILAYLDLSSSSFYVRQGEGDRASRFGMTFRSSKDRFPMVQSMEMRFGPLYRPKEAGEGVTTGLMRGMLATQVKEAVASMTAATAATTHDGMGVPHVPAVGDWRSRLTYLIVFVVQAAVPIAAALVAQYIVAQKLALLARSGSLSRQGSMRQPSSTDGQHSLRRSMSLSDEKHSTSSSSTAHNRSGSLRDSTGSSLSRSHSYLRSVPKLKMPDASPRSPTGPLMPARHSAEPSHGSRLYLQLPSIEGISDNRLHRQRREERRKRLPTAPSTVTMADHLDPFGISPGGMASVSVQAMGEHATGSRRVTPSPPPSRAGGMAEDMRHIHPAPVAAHTATHRHRRSVSHPVDLIGVPTIHSNHRSNLTSGLGMTFEETDGVMDHPSDPTLAAF